MILRLLLTIAAVIVGLTTMARPSGATMPGTFVWCMTTETTRPDTCPPEHGKGVYGLREVHVIRWEGLDVPRRLMPSFRADATAYNSVPGQTDDRPCESADGSDICKLHAEGKETCARNGMPFDTVLWSRATGLCTVRDRTASKFSHRVDYHVGGAEAFAEARAFGIKRNQLFYVVSSPR